MLERPTWPGTQGIFLLANNPLGTKDLILGKQNSAKSCVNLEAHPSPVELSDETLALANTLTADL